MNWVLIIVFWYRGEFGIIKTEFQDHTSCYVAQELIKAQLKNTTVVVVEGCYERSMPEVKHDNYTPFQ